MHYAAIIHRPRSAYAHALDETHYIFRLRAQRGDLASCTFHYADRAAAEMSLAFPGLPMPLVRSDTLYDWFEIALETPFARIAYYFELNDGRETCLYYGDCFEKGTGQTGADYFQFPYNHRADRMDVPPWVLDAVVYNIFPDSFASGHREISGRAQTALHEGQPCASRLGGTINGIRENLDYIRRLGCNCVYLNPIFAARAYHKYDLIDYFHIDPCRGTDEDFRALVREAHAMGMRVIIDGVFNHMGAGHPAFQDVLAKGKASPYFGWFYSLPDAVRYPAEGELPAYACFAYVPDMPKTDTANPDARRYFCEVGSYWVREFDVDGWRLDVANELDDGFLRAFRQAVRREKADALLIAEAWEEASHYLAGDMVDSAMNYDFRRFCRQFFAEELLDAAAFDLRVSNLLMRYKTQALPAQLNLLDSHDVSRFLSLCGGDTDKMELAVLFQMTFIGMPCVFYGDERGMAGVAEDEYRRPMPWAAVETPLQETYRRMIALRREHPALSRGRFETVAARGRLYAYARVWQGERVTVFLNAGDTDADISAPEGGEMRLQKGLRGGRLAPRGYAAFAGRETR
ncbi:MAG: glycoside hydrolase family 13 protein [Oscillospiraceae bacterium]|jgi:glycosidase|nr:glycoside hydrolase family 13 protein [Oscillospiraceae bacterium]